MKFAKKGELLRLSKDERGEVYEFQAGDTFHHMIVTNSGFTRGGDYHKVDSFVVMSKGSGIWLLKDPKNIEPRRQLAQNAGEMIRLPAGITHAFRSYGDGTTFIEWLDATGPFETFYDDEMRAETMEANKKLLRATEKL